MLHICYYIYINILYMHITISYICVCVCVCMCVCVSNISMLQKKSLNRKVSCGQIPVQHPQKITRATSVNVFIINFEQVFTHRETYYLIQESLYCLNIPKKWMFVVLLFSVFRQNKKKTYTQRKKARPHSFLFRISWIWTESEIKNFAVRHFQGSRNYQLILRVCFNTP